MSSGEDMKKKNYHSETGQLKLLLDLELLQKKIVQYPLYLLSACHAPGFEQRRQILLSGTLWSIYKELLEGRTILYLS